MISNRLSSFATPRYAQDDRPFAKVGCSQLAKAEPDFNELRELPKKIRELKQLLRQAGFEELPGKGSHTNWIHPLYSGKITVSGKDSADAKTYQEKEILGAIQQIKESQDDEQT